MICFGVGMRVVVWHAGKMLDEPSCVRRPSVEKRTNSVRAEIMEELAIREGWLADHCTAAVLAKLKMPSRCTRHPRRQNPAADEDILNLLFAIAAPSISLRFSEVQRSLPERVVLNLGF